MSVKKSKAGKPEVRTSTMTDGQQRAMKALAFATKAARDFSVFKTVAGVMSIEEDSAGDEHDDVWNVIEDLAKKCFNGPEDDLEEMLSKGFSVSGMDERVQDAYNHHIDALRAETLAGFALGVAWGRLQTESTR
jgi:hypothetical protein